MEKQFETVLRKISIKDRLPDKEDYYFCELSDNIKDVVYYSPEKQFWSFCVIKHLTKEQVDFCGMCCNNVEYWYEEV